MQERQAVPLSSVRPVLYVLSGFAAAFALVYVQNNVIAPSRSQARLRRRGAIRRHRRTESIPSEVVDTPSFRAVSHLRQLESEDTVYGTFRIETEDGRRVECGLLPSFLATRDQLMVEVGVPEAQADRVRDMMEETFLESFLALDFPPSHIVRDGTVERDYLTEQLQRRGISRISIERTLERFNEDSNYGEDVRERRDNGERVTLTTSAAPETPTRVQPLDGGETVVDDQSVFSWRDGNPDSSSSREGQNLLNLLYHIAEDQAKRDGYIHRGVTCNSCGAMPIQGIRYRCSNCIDYDLCETCEGMGVHMKTHLFYKVRIPAPFLGNPRQSQPVWYPGKPAMLPRSLPRQMAKRFMADTNFENTELDALWDQFRCLANAEWPNDPNQLGMAIDRKTFDRCFVPNTANRPPPPSLIYDRMFSFYDSNNDGFIGFEEFLTGLASLNNKSNDERLRRVFRGYDIDGDGLVDRKDFLRVFRAYYALSRELTKDMVAGMEDDFMDNGARDVLLGSQPISSAFPGSVPAGDPSRTGEGKRVNREGDMEIVDSEGILRQDSNDTANRHAVVGDAAIRGQFSRARPLFPSNVRLPAVQPDRSALHVSGGDENEDNDGNDSDGASGSSFGSDHWPPAEHILEEDIVNALGAYVPLQEVTDPVDRARIGTAVYHRMRDDDQRRINEARRHGIHERWRRRVFYTDEEDGATAPEGYESDDSFNGMSDVGAVDEHPSLESHPPSPRSRSSSKVRFQDDLTDDYDVRSNPSTSSRSIPVGERWGGFEIPEVERDVGKEILYQVTQQGFNELLDSLFKPTEDLLMEVWRTRAERKYWARQIEISQQMDPRRRSAREDARSAKEAGERKPSTESLPQDKPLEELLNRTGYSVARPPLDVDPRSGLAPPSPDRTVSEEEVHPTHLAHPEEDEYIDPTLPHNRPDSPQFEHPVVTGQPPLPLGTEVHFDPTLPQNRPDEEPRHSLPSLLDVQFGSQPSFASQSALASRTAFTSQNPFTTQTPFASQNPFPSRSPSTSQPPFAWSANSATTTHGQTQGHRPTQTLPFQLRPTGTPSLPAPFSQTPASPEAEATAPKPPISPTQPLHPPSPSHEQIPPTMPDAQTLLRWAFLNQVEREAKQRGGVGAKLTFDEFARRMTGDRGRRLAFVASWIEMASF